MNTALVAGKCGRQNTFCCMAVRDGTRPRRPEARSSSYSSSTNTSGNTSLFTCSVRSEPSSISPAFLRSSDHIPNTVFSAVLRKKHKHRPTKSSSSSKLEYLSYRRESDSSVGIVTRLWTVQSAVLSVAKSYKQHAAYSVRYTGRQPQDHNRR
jgi:hypothetical protein